MKGQSREVFKQLSELISIHTAKRFNDVASVSLAVELAEPHVVEIQCLVEFYGTDVSLAKHLEPKPNICSNGKVTGSDQSFQRGRWIVSTRQLLQGDNGLFAVHGVLQVF